MYTSSSVYPQLCAVNHTYQRQCKLKLTLAKTEKKLICFDILYIIKLHIDRYIEEID